MNDAIEKIKNTVICGDSIEIMKNLPDDSIDVIVTDPVWPGTNVDFGITRDPAEIWKDAVKEILRLTDRLIVILGCNSDPRFLNIPDQMPFLRYVWLTRIPPSPRGPILYDADIAYVFGHNRLNGSNRVMPGYCVARVQDLVLPIGLHPCPRNPNHMRYLIHHYSRPGDFILDPFCGSGQILKAAKSLKRNFCGIDINRDYVKLSCSVIDTVPFDMFETDKSVYKKTNQINMSIDQTKRI